MCTKRQNISLGFATEAFPAGSHMCLIYESEEQRKTVISKYLDSGLLGNERVAYFADDMQPGECESWLEEIGVGISKNEDARAFSVSDASNTYCPDGIFKPGRMLDTLKDFYGKSVSDGYDNCRVSGEMGWALRGMPGSDRLMEYEARVNIVLETHPVTAICQYDVHRFDGAVIMDVMRVHPLMIVRDQIVRNPFFLKPEEFLTEFEHRGLEG